MHLPLVVEYWLQLVDQWEVFNQVSHLQGLAVTTDHQPLPSVEDQLCRGRWWCSDVVCSYSLGALARVLQAKVNPHLCFAWGHIAWGHIA